MSTRFDTEMWICDVQESIVCKGGGGGGGGGTQTTVQEPFAEQKPFLVRGFQRSEDLSRAPVEFFPGSTVTPYSPESEFAFAAQAQRALQGSPLVFGAQNELARILSGSYLPGMPFQSPQVSRPPLPIEGKGQAEPGQPGQQGTPAVNFPDPATFGPSPAAAPGAPNLPPPSPSPPPQLTAPAPAPAPSTPDPNSLTEGTVWPPGSAPPPAPSGMEWNFTTQGWVLREEDDMGGDN